MLGGLLLWSSGGTVAAQTETLAETSGREALERGIRLYEEADLEGALAALDEAVERRLTRGDVLRLLASRALVRFALGYFEPLERDLLALASLEPDYELGMRAPPPLQAAHARLKERVSTPLEVRVELEALEAGVRLRASTRGDSAGIVRSISLTARRAGRGEWQRGEDGTLVLPVLSGERVELHAEALGPGGAVVATDGTLEAPRTEVVPLRRQIDSARPGMSPVGKGLVIVGAVVLVAIATVLGIVLSGSSDDGTRPQGPFVER